MAQYFSILTTYGTQAFAKALSSNQPLRLTTFAVGDGNGQNVTPTANRTALAREKHRAAVSAVSLDPRNNKQVIVELTLPENVGGFYIREMGVFDNQNKLVAYANCPESFKPTLESGSGKVQVLRMILQIASSSAVTLSVDNSVIFATKGQLTPKPITATSTNSVGDDGHTHAIDKASLTTAGIVQLNSATNNTSETQAATPKAVKTVKDQLDSVQRGQNNYILNSKKSNAVDSNSADTVATSAAVKAAYDKAVSAEKNNRYQKIYVGQSDLQLDLTSRQQIIDIFGGSYRESGYLSLAAHNNNTSNINGLPLTTKSPVVLTFYLMGGYSIFYCHYPTLNRYFFSSTNFNNPALQLNWIEQTTNQQAVLLSGNQDIAGNKSFNATLETKYRFIVRRNEEKFTPYMWLLDQSLDMTGGTAKNKSIGAIIWRAGANDGVAKVNLKGYLLEDKNAFAEIGAWNAENQYKVLFKGFSKTNNVVIGKSTDNEKDRLQVAGTISATTPPVNGADDQVVTIGWAKNAGRAFVSKSGDTMTGGLTTKWVTSENRGNGAYADQYRVEAPYYVNAGNANGRNIYHPYLKGKVMNGDGWGSAFSLGYTTPTARNQFGHGAIHLIEDNGTQRLWKFEHNGDFVSAGDVRSSSGRSLDKAIYREGNPHDIALSWLSDGLKVRVDKTDLGRVAFKGDLAARRTAHSRVVNLSGRNINVDGYLIIYPSGKIEQTFIYRGLSMVWLEQEAAMRSGNRGRFLQIPLWTAMPNDVVWAETVLIKGSGNHATYLAEAGEWIGAFSKFTSTNSRVDMHYTRLTGNTDEVIDIIVKVEGY